MNGRERALQARICGRMVEQGQRLSVREMEMGLLVQEGLTNDEIADELTVSTHTVKHTIAALLQKSGARNRVELANWMRRYK